MRENPFISISGGKGSGKTTIANHLHQRFFENWYMCSDFSFASPLKDALCLWFGWDRVRLDSDYDYKEGSTRDDGSPDPYCQALGLNRRKIMQKFGTECMRNNMHLDFWIILADLGLQLNKIPPANLYVISDARMTNELEWIKRLNGYQLLISRVECPRGTDPATIDRSAAPPDPDKHPSEQEFLLWTEYDENLINLIDHNQTEIANKNTLIKHLDDVTIPAIRKHFGMTKKGPHDPWLYR